MIIKQRIVSAGTAAPYRGLFGRYLSGLSCINPFLDDMPEIANQALNWPCRCITESANRVAFNLFGDIQKHVDLMLFGLAAL